MSEELLSCIYTTKHMGRENEHKNCRHGKVDETDKRKTQQECMVRLWIEWGSGISRTRRRLRRRYRRYHCIIFPSRI